MVQDLPLSSAMEMPRFVVLVSFVFCVACLLFYVRYVRTTGKKIEPVQNTPVTRRVAVHGDDSSSVV